MQPDPLALQAPLCGFRAFVARESEWALACSSVVTSYGSRPCLPLGDPVPPLETDRIRGLHGFASAKRDLSSPWGRGQVGTVSSFKGAPTLVCLCTTHSGWDP